MAAERYLTTQELAGLATQMIQQVHEASKPAKHLTEAEFADREGVEVTTAAQWRKNGTGPAHILITKSATRTTIRYRLADIEEWEQSRLVTPAAAPA